MKEFEKVIGYNSIKLELKRVCDIMRNNEKYKALGVSTPRGILLHGNPGVGKTLMANCFIEASKRPAYLCRKDKSNGDFINTIKETFDKAKQNTPSIVFLDDMDKFANGDNRHPNAEEYVTIQSCIDNIANEEVFVLATANDLSYLPRSLLRVGRFDNIIEVKNPIGDDATKIVSYYLSQKRFIDEIDAQQIAYLLNGRSCAELEAVINEAGIYAGSQNKDRIDMDDIIRACMRIIYDAPEEMDSYSKDVLERIAYHEAGHAVVAEILEPNSINLVSICKRSREIGGVTSYNQNEDYFYQKKYMDYRVMSLLAGRAATEIKFDEIDIGANSDMERAYEIIKRFVNSYGNFGFSFITGRSSISNTSLSNIENQISSEMERYYKQAHKLLASNRCFLDDLAHEIMNKKILTNKDIQRIKNNNDIVTPCFNM